MNEENYTINIGDFKVAETTYQNRCLSASFGGQGVSSEVIPWAEQGNPWDWKYENGEFVFDAIEMPTQTPAPTQMEKLISVLLKSGKLTKEEYNYIIGE